MILCLLLIGLAAAGVHLLPYLLVYLVLAAAGGLGPRPPVSLPHPAPASKPSPAPPGS